MPYSQLLQRSFDVVRREPALWVLGMIFALFGGGGGQGNINWNGGAGDGGDQWGGIQPQAPAWLTPENIGVALLLLILVVLLLGTIGLVVQSVAQAGLIHGTARAATGEDVHWGDLWRAGWSQAGRRVLGLRFLLAMPALFLLLLAIGVFFVVALPLITSVLEGGRPTPGLLLASLGGILIVLPIFLLIALGAWLFSLVGNFAVRAIVLEGRPVLAAVEEGWNLFRANVRATILFAILLGVIGLLIGMVVGFATLFLALLLGVPLFFLLAAQQFPLFLTVGAVVAGGVVVGALSALLNGPLLAYFETAWTLAWQHLKGVGVEMEPVATL